MVELIMNDQFRAILYQALGYMIGVFIGFGIVAIFQRGFLFKFLIVKASMGRKILIRIRKVIYMDYKIGKIEEGDLVFGRKENKKRINNMKSEYVYRSLGINWIDIDGEKWCILPPKDISAIAGFDPEKVESLITRALYKPPIEDIKEKLFMALIIAAVLGTIINLYFTYNILTNVKNIITAIDAMKGGMVIATGG